jgi:sulfonate transport system ATP-binding protein
MLSLERIGKTYLNGVHALEAITLGVEPGEIVAVIGGSGCGKSTLLRAISGLDTPTQGSVRLDNVAVTKPHEKIGIIFQEPRLLPWLSVAGNVGFGIEDRPKAERRERVAHALDRVGLTDKAEVWPRELSGGQAQRVAIARALVPRPQVLLLDEPFSALDAGLRANMREMVKRRLQAEGVTGILVTHDQQEALSFADQLAVLEHGRVVQSGSPRELYLQPRTEMLANFLGDALILESRVTGGETETPLGRIRVARATRDGLVRVMLRPEQVRLVPWSEGTPTAQIVSASFEGPITVVRFTAGATTFTLKVPSADAPLQGRASIVLIGTGHVIPG